MADERNEVRLSEGDLSAFADKLDSWADGLPAEERGLLQFLLARAEASGARELVTSQEGEMTTDASPGTLASAMLRPMLQQGVTTRSEQGSGQGSGQESAAMRQAARPCNWSTWSRGVPP